MQTAGIVIDDGAYFKGGIDITREKAASERPVSKGNGQAVPATAATATDSKGARPV